MMMMNGGGIDSTNPNT